MPIGPCALPRSPQQQFLFQKAMRTTNPNARKAMLRAVKR